MRVNYGGVDFGREKHKIVEHIRRTGENDKLFKWSSVFRVG